MLIMFDDLIANLEDNKKVSLIVKELLMKDKKSNISLVFTSQFYFKVPKTIRLNSLFMMKIPSKRELQ